MGHFEVGEYRLWLAQVYGPEAPPAPDVLADLEQPKDAAVAAEVREEARRPESSRTERPVVTMESLVFGD